MSVMIIKNITFIKVLNSLFFNYHYHIRSHLEQFRDYTKMKGLVEELRIANIRSYTLKYKEGEEIQYFKIKYDSNEKFLNNAATLKALRAIKYNIELPEDQFDYTFIDTAIEALKNAIIEDLPEWQEASWG
ncbi:hypothetical protein [Paenibacillus polymyxa]|uniref:hypothetical protein n=1 Tax=Paenibacillus polymyxa TaxID=1406 RepID=UPI00021BBB7D|nr:hypothetical protein [Paenibacillus polymyxa]MDN4106679.1 hypothetical protein [Paenibacillus polymyxa]CCC86295.1 hypothetical protein PPM_p0145 [Paenibacillus polymyxa M1]